MVRLRDHQTRFIFGKVRYHAHLSGNNKIAVQRPGSKKKCPFLDPQHQREAIFYIDPFFPRKLT
jgi:hypothetical protein